MINIITDYLLPNINDIELNKFKLIKSIDFEYNYYIRGSTSPNFTTYLKTIVNDPIEDFSYFDLELKYWKSKTDKLYTKN